MDDSWSSGGSWIANDTPDYVFEVEEFHRGTDQMVFVHLMVRTWTPRALKQMLHDFEVFREAVPLPCVYAVGDLGDDKWAHFVRLFGFQPLSEVDCTDGSRRQLFIHLKDTTNVGQSDPETIKQPAE